MLSDVSTWNEGVCANPRTAELLTAKRRVAVAELLRIDESMVGLVIFNEVNGKNDGVCKVLRGWVTLFSTVMALPAFIAVLRGLEEKKKRQISN